MSPLRAIGLLCAAFMAVVCLEGGDPFAGRFLATYTDELGDTGVADRCPLPSSEQAALEPERPGCAFIPFRDGRGLNLLCDSSWERVHLDVRWDPSGDGGRGQGVLDGGGCRALFRFEWHRETGGPTDAS